jgi:Phasin protein
MIKRTGQPKRITGAAASSSSQLMAAIRGRIGGSDAGGGQVPISWGTGRSRWCHPQRRQPPAVAHTAGAAYRGGAAQQAELAKEAFEKALGNMRELAEMVTKAQQGAIDTMSGRISQSLDEIKEMALKMKEPYATETQPTAKAATAKA